MVEPETGVSTIDVSGPTAPVTYRRSLLASRVSGGIAGVWLPR